VSAAVSALDLVAGWDVPHASAAVVRHGATTTIGDTTRRFRIASVAKLLAAYTVLVAVEEGTVMLEQPAGPPGSTLRHLLAHASGYGFDSDSPVLAAPGTRRIYSNRGIEAAAGVLADACGIGFGTYQHEAVLDPLGMAATTLDGSPAHEVWSTVDDLVRFVVELRAPRLLAPATVTEMFSVQFPGLPGVLPGIGRYESLDWGLGFERNFSRPDHWAGARVSSESVGHFGGAGTFAWFDPTIDLGCVCLTDRDFGPWATDAWPKFCDAVVAESGASPT
jgi:CubicO group peptidase (beta-lactamase class C family)